MDISREPVPLDSGKTADGLLVDSYTTGEAMIAALNLPSRPRGVICINGGTASLDNEEQVHALLKEIVRFAAERKIVLITGGTDAGICRLLGQEMEKLEYPAPCIGVVPRGRVKWRENPERSTTLAPHHSHFILVKSNEWGGETDAMYNLAKSLSRSRPLGVFFFGGGRVTLSEMEHASATPGCTLIPIVGTGRITDALVLARSGESIEKNETVGNIPNGAHRLRNVAEYKGIRPYDVQRPPEFLQKLLSALFQGTLRERLAERGFLETARDIRRQTLQRIPGLGRKS